MSGLFVVVGGALFDHGCYGLLFSTLLLVFVALMQLLLTVGVACLYLWTVI